jgi:hypothetical protein
MTVNKIAPASITDIEQHIAKVTAQLQKAREQEFSTAETVFLTAQQTTAAALARLAALEAIPASTPARISKAQADLNIQQAQLASANKIYNALIAAQKAAEHFATDVTAVMAGKKLGKKIKFTKKEKAIIKDDKKAAKKTAKTEIKTAKAEKKLAKETAKKVAKEVAKNVAKDELKETTKKTAKTAKGIIKERVAVATAEPANFEASTSEATFPDTAVVDSTTTNPALAATEKKIAATPTAKKSAVKKVSVNKTPNAPKTTAESPAVIDAIEQGRKQHKSVDGTEAVEASVIETSAVENSVIENPSVETIAAPYARPTNSSIETPDEAV